MSTIQHVYHFEAKPNYMNSVLNYELLVKTTELKKPVSDNST